MAHSIHVGFLSVDDFMQQVIGAIVEKNIITAKNIYVSDKNAAHIAEYREQGMNVLPDDPAVLMKSEIVVIAAPKRDFGTVLAPISTLTRGKIVVVLSEGIDCNYVQERVAKGTLVAAAMPAVGADGKRAVQMEYSAGFPEYMKDAASDIAGSICE